MSRWLRCAAAVLLLAVGLATAIAAIAVHELWWGLPLTTVALLAALVAVGRGWTTRLPLASGFVGGVAWVVPERAGGGYAIAASPRGYLLLLLAFVAMLVAVATLPRPKRGVDAEVGGPPT